MLLMETDLSRGDHPEVYIFLFEFLSRRLSRGPKILHNTTQDQQRVSNQKKLNRLSLWPR